jgi:predicted nucleic acid-binding protein
VLRGRGHERFRSLIAGSEVVTCLPVLQEVLQGFDSDAAYRVARMSLAELYRSAGRLGLTVRSSVDCLIAVCALWNGEIILHKDRDFESLARVSPLRTLWFDASAE